MTGVVIDWKAGEYRRYKVAKFPPASQLDDYRKTNPSDVVEIQSETVDTGEHKMFFGHSAKHFITTIRRPADNNNGGAEETVDGWYIEQEIPDNECAPDYVHSEPFYAIGTALVLPPQIAHFNHTGPVPTGLAVKLTLTRKVMDSTGKADRIVKTEETVEELSDSPLSPSLFEPPSGVRENPNLHTTRSAN
jgi:hypothetical protein